MSARKRWSWVLLLGLAGCGTTDVDLGYNDPPVAPGDCLGGEVVHRPFYWDGPALLWFGPDGEAPACPYDSLPPSYEGHADLVAPSACEACTCEPPTGSCALPSTVTASSKDCGNFNAGMPAPFNAPAPWDGHCDSTKQLPVGAAYALKIGALAMTENGCAPGPTLPAKVVSSFWKTSARACEGKGWQAGLTSGAICIPGEDPIPQGFRLCVTHEGDVPCSTAEDNSFTEPHVFYAGVLDDRQCSDCSCGPPVGSICTATFSIYKGGDLTCGGAPVDQVTISSAGPKCLDIEPPGQSLGSKSAGPTTYTPGVCQPMGGEPNGLAATGTEPVTFCCKP